MPDWNQTLMHLQWHNSCVQRGVLHYWKTPPTCIHMHTHSKGAIDKRNTCQQSSGRANQNPLVMLQIYISHLLKCNFDTTN